MYDIDGNNNTSATVDALHARGAHVICYVPVGEWTPYMYDANDPRWAPLKGQPFNGTDRWLNTNPAGPNYHTLLELETLQFENCKNKGFDAIQPDGDRRGRGPRGQLQRGPAHGRPRSTRTSSSSSRSRTRWA